MSTAFAFVTLDDGGVLGEHSTVTIDGQTQHIPARHSGGVLAPKRILETVDKMGYYAPLYYDTLRDVEGGCAFEVVEKAGGVEPR